MEEEKRKMVFMGKNMAEIPCFRQTFLYSISSGLGVGLLYFMMTSKTQKAMHVAFGTYAGVTLGYWFYCRYNYSVKKFSYDQLKVGMQKSALYQGTEVEEEIKKNN